jgi:hypothetical protein
MYDFYELLVMPFGLCNAPSTFTTFMNFIFHAKSDEFVIIYIDHIFVYSKLVEEHVEHLKSMLKKLRVNNLYTNQLKSEYPSLEMEFLGHVLFQERVN